MKRIFHFVKSNNLSGLENVVINICTLVKGYDYTYISTKGPINKYLKKYGIKHITISKLTPWNIFKVIKKYHPDIVQAHDARASVFLAPSYFYCKEHHIKMISELHNNDPKMKKWWRLRSILYSLGSLAFDEIIEVSKDILRDYSYSWIISNKKIKYIQNIVNPFRVKDKLLQRQSYKKWDCIFIGRFTYQKDPFKFINIINELKKVKHNIKSVMVGSGILFKRSKQLSHKLHLDKNIKFVGFQENPYKYIQESKLLIITSRYEGLCLVSLESLMIGDPVISTSVPGLLGIINNSCGSFAKSNKGFAKEILLLLNNKNLYINKCKNAKKQFNKINNVRHFVKSYKNIYK